MKSLLITILLLIIASTAQAQSLLPDDVKFDHAWVKGLYWNPSELPEWGVFVDVQEEMMFGAVYGYKNNEPSFVVFLGSAVSLDPLTFEGDVFFVTEPGVRQDDVGNFRWEATADAASPAARLTITSNILNKTNLKLVRTNYVETDKVDMLTGGDWNVIRRTLGISFGDHYSISDTRFHQDGITYATMSDLSSPERIGLVGYYPPGDGDVYAMLIEFTDTSDVFYVFYANNTDMYGRYWLISEGDSPSGGGSYFRGSADTMQKPYSGGGGGGESTAHVEAVLDSDSKINVTAQEDMKSFEFSMYSKKKESLNQQFTEQSVQMAFEKLTARLKSKESQME
jgi:hypothetical protein